jgi:hypothetical protein
MKMPNVQQQHFALKGGLDQLTPAIELEPGKLFDAQNYEPEISGGYRRVDGFERVDGQQSPTSATYWQLPVTITGNIFATQSITGLTSGATARVLLVVGSTLVLGRVVGTFVSSESIQVASVTQATATGPSQSISEPDASNDADYMLLAANDRRGDILQVPGSGRIRGVWVYKDTLYAFRDNVGATAGLMYKATASGWVLVPFGTEVQFSSATGGSTPIAVGATIGNLGAAPAKTATVLAVLTRAGTWGTDAVGTLIITPVTGVFSSADPVFVGATQKGVTTTAATAIKRNPGGSVELVNANFTGSTDTQKVYGCDGVNLAFEFDGVNYIPIRTGMAVDTPAHIIFHRFYLFLSFRGSVQFCGIGNPYAWTSVLGAGEIAMADDVTGFMPQGGNNAGSTLAIFTRSRVYMLYGSSSANFNLVLSIFDMGYFAGTMQAVSNNTFGLTARGIQSLITTLTYGDFDYASVSHAVTPFIVSRRGMETASTSLRAKDQYRVFFNDGSALAVGLTGEKVSGILPLQYGMPVRCITTTTLSTGVEVTYFGSDNGYVYQDNTGTSFDGLAIESWIRPAFNHFKSPRIRKRFRRAVFEVKAAGFSQVNIGYDLGYGNPDVSPPEGITNSQVLTGGFWDQFTWDSFTWDGKVVSDISMALTGTEKNISFLFYSSRAQDKSHTVQGCTVLFTPQRLER